MAQNMSCAGQCISPDQECCNYGDGDYAPCAAGNVCVPNNDDYPDRTCCAPAIVNPGARLPTKPFAPLRAWFKNRSTPVSRLERFWACRQGSCTRAAHNPYSDPYAGLG